MLCPLLRQYWGYWLQFPWLLASNRSTLSIRLPLPLSGGNGYAQLPCQGRSTKMTILIGLVKYPLEARLEVCIHHTCGTVLALPTAYPQPYPQEWVRVDIMCLIRHPLCYPMGYELP